MLRRHDCRRLPTANQGCNRNLNHLPIGCADLRNQWLGNSPLTFGFIRRLTHPTIVSRRDLVVYVATTSAISLAIALGADVASHLTFFGGWAAAFRSWSITIVVVAVIAIPVASAIGRSQLELHRAKLAVEELSRIDPMTGLPNRRAVFELAERSEAQTMVLVIFDIDRFKRVNDTLGHLAGDDVIRRVSQMMAEALQPLGTVGRIGGEEFMLVGSDVDIDRLVASLADFRERLATTSILTRDSAVTVTMSAGVAVLWEGADFNDLYAEADHALYRAKALGRNRVCYSNSFDARLDRTATRDEAMWRDDAEEEFSPRTTDRDSRSSVA